MVTFPFVLKKIRKFKQTNKNFYKKLKADLLKHQGRLPIHDGIEVISVGTTFLRFLEIAKQLNKRTAVVTDSDGSLDELDTKYADYTAGKTPNIAIFYDRTIDGGNLVIGKNKKPFNYNTLEPKIVKSNGLAAMNKILGKMYADEDSLHIHMRANKTDVALAIFDTTEPFKVPQYIADALAWIDADA
jgi:putative ATP-dependent endonuclease of OLD family